MSVAILEPAPMDSSKPLRTRSSYAAPTKAEVDAIMTRLRQLAKSKGGRLISTAWRGGKNKLEWECEYGHQWQAVATNVENNGTWCPYCNGNARYSIEEVRQIASEKGVTLLSTKYSNNQTALHWRCIHGATWWMSFRALLTGGGHNRYCSECNKRGRRRLPPPSHREHANTALAG